MKSLTETLASELNESNIKVNQVFNYIKSWIYQPASESEALSMIRNIVGGFRAAVDDRNRYLTDEDYKEANAVMNETIKTMEKELKGILYK